MPVTIQKEIHSWRPETDLFEGDYFFILKLNPVKRSITFDLISNAEYPGCSPGDKYSLDSKDLTEYELQVAMRDVEGVRFLGLKEVRIPDSGGIYDNPQLQIKDALPYLAWLLERTKNTQEKANVFWAMDTLKKYSA